jgi:hypothetical protein
MQVPQFLRYFEAAAATAAADAGAAPSAHQQAAQQMAAAAGEDSPEKQENRELRARLEAMELELQELRRYKTLTGLVCVCCVCCVCVCALLLIVLLVSLLVGCAEGGEEQAAAPAPLARGKGARRPYGNVARKQPPPKTTNTNPLGGGDSNEASGSDYSSASDSSSSSSSSDDEEEEGEGGSGKTEAWGGTSFFYFTNSDDEEAETLRQGEAYASRGGAHAGTTRNADGRRRSTRSTGQSGEYADHDSGDDESGEGDGAYAQKVRGMIAELEEEAKQLGGNLSKAYRKLCLKYHPDKNVGVDEDAIKALHTARGRLKAKYKEAAAAAPTASDAEDELFNAAQCTGKGKRQETEAATGSVCSCMCVCVCVCVCVCLCVCALVCFFSDCASCLFACLWCVQKEKRWRVVMAMPLK